MLIKFIDSQYSDVKDEFQRFLVYLGFARMLIDNELMKQNIDLQMSIDAKYGDVAPEDIKHLLPQDALVFIYFNRIHSTNAWFCVIRIHNPQHPLDEIETHRFDVPKFDKLKIKPFMSSVSEEMNTAIRNTVRAYYDSIQSIGGDE